MYVLYSIGKRWKRKSLGKKSLNPVRIGDLQFPPKTTHYKPFPDAEDEEKLLLADTNKGDECILIFSRES